MTQDDGRWRTDKGGSNAVRAKGREGNGGSDTGRRICGTATAGEGETEQRLSLER